MKFLTWLGMAVITVSVVAYQIFVAQKVYSYTLMKLGAPSITFIQMWGALCFIQICAMNQDMLNLKYAKKEYKEGLTLAGSMVLDLSFSWLFAYWIFA